ncbi:MAG TPA: RNase P subunit p30 family protein [Candidatus Nanoarchaeia archaeon]|nr:RNase P subunit p30 family protein [Candidatus Nanoarchaeia archaeon]
MKPSIIIKSENFEKARAEIKKNKDKTIVFTSNDDELNRKILEKEKIDVFLISLSGRKDWQKQRNSGLDNVMAKEASKKGVIIAINLDELINAGEKEKEIILARIRQNVELCNKHKLKMTFLGKTKKDPYELKALGLVLGMPTWMLVNL